MAKSITKTNRPRLTLDIPSALRRRIKVAAAAHDLSVSDYVTRILDRAVPGGGRALKKKADGRIMADMVRRSAALRAEQATLFADDSADLIREVRLERNGQL